MISTYRERYADGRTRRVYRCAVCTMSRLAEPVDAWVRQVIEERLGRPDVIDLLAEDEDADRVDALREQAITLRRRRDSTVKLWARGVLDDQELETAKREIVDELARVEADLAEAGRQNALVPLIGAEDPPSQWRALAGKVDREQAVIAALTQVWLLPPPSGRRRFDPDTVEFDWNRPRR